MEPGDFQALRLAFFDGGFGDFASEIDGAFLESLPPSEIFRFLQSDRTAGDELFSSLRRDWVMMFIERIERKARLREDIRNLASELEATEVLLGTVAADSVDARERPDDQIEWVRLDDATVSEKLMSLAGKVRSYLEEPDPEFGSGDDSPEYPS